MDIKRLEEVRKVVLAGIEKEFVDELIPAVLSKEGETPVLNVYLDAGEESTGITNGEFFFLQSDPGDEIQYFVNLITVYEQIPEENLDEVCRAVAGVNIYTPAGAFVVDFASGNLVYKFMVPISIEAAPEAVKDTVDMTMGIAFSAVNDLAYLLAEVCDGERSASSAIEVFGSDE